MTSRDLRTAIDHLLRKQDGLARRIAEGEADRVVLTIATMKVTPLFQEIITQDLAGSNLTGSKRAGACAKE